MARELGKDKFGVQRTMRRKDFFGDSLGQFALNAMSGLVGQMTYFYTDKVGVAAGAVATILLICKIVDAFTDLIMGNIVDHTKPGKEKYRPWLIKAGIPAGILTALMFTVPKGSSGLQIAYLLITNLLFTAVATPPPGRSPAHSPPATPGPPPRSASSRSCSPYRAGPGTPPGP